VTSRILLPIASLALLLGFASDALAAQAKAAVSAVGEPVRKSAVVTSPVWRDAGYAASSTATLRLGDVDLTRVSEVMNYNKTRGAKPMQTGINRSADVESLKALPVLSWKTTATGGQVARLQVTSPDAVGLRVGLQMGSIDSRAELRAAGSDAPGKVVAAVSAAEAKRLSNAKGVYWTPSTDGASQIIEVYLPKGVATTTVKLRVGNVSHLLATSRKDTLLKEFGDSGTCNQDNVCRNAALGVNYTNVAKSVARMFFTDDVGSFFCTGTLLADTAPGTQIPYFYTAHHCISTQSAANTLETDWNYERAACGTGGEPTPTVVTTGATYLYSEGGTDASLLRLNSAPPAGAFFAGWRSTAMTANAVVLDVHHPSADVKKSSLGQFISSTTVRHAVGWTSGTTEAGSSGSGLFTATGPSGAYELRGGLQGGSASCANSGNVNTAGNRDEFSRFDVVYPNISKWLAPAGGVFNGPTRDNSGVWYVPAESGWGVTAYQYNNAAQVLFVTWYVYDSTGKANWYQIVGDWTGTDVYSGPVRNYRGPNWGPTFNPASVTFTNVGTATVTFTSDSAATLTYTVDGQTRTVTLSKFGT
jgi:lysyl endopeptidase